MVNLEELTLYLTIYVENAFIDGTYIYDRILAHVPQLHIFNFCICTQIRMEDLVRHLSKDDIQGTFPNTIYQKVECMVEYGYHQATCHVFSLPFMFDYLGDIGNTFPSIIFTHVRRLMVFDCVPFEHEFFIRIAWSFPLLEYLSVTNYKSQSQLSNKLNSIVKYPHLSWLQLDCVHEDYVEQFLNETKNTSTLSNQVNSLVYSIRCCDGKLYKICNTTQLYQSERIRSWLSKRRTFKRFQCLFSSTINLFLF
jgi:hypothetical protein